MRRILTIVRLLLILLLVAPSWGAGVQIYLNNKPFKGKTSGPASDLNLEAAVAAEVLGLQSALKVDASTLELEGESIALVNESGLLMVRAKDLTRHFGGKYQYNRELGMVDITAYDPVANAKKALVAVLKQPKLNTDADFQVIALLAKQVLIQHLTLDLKEEFEMEFLDEKEWARVAGGQDGGSLVTYRASRNGGGTGHYHFYTRKGQPPLAALGGLTWMWGLTWANLNSDAKKDSLCEAFAFWTEVSAFEQLVGSSRESQVLHAGASPAVKENYLTLRDQSKLGGVEGAIRYMKDRR